MKACWNDHLVVLVHQVVVAEHLGVGREGAAGHGGPDDDGVGVNGFRRQEVILHAILEDVLGRADLLDVDVQIELGAAEGVPHGDDVGLAGAAGDGGEGEVDAVGAALEGREVAGQAVAGGLVGVELDVHLVAEELAGGLDGLVDHAGRGGAGGILEADAVEGNLRLHDLLDTLGVELGGVGALVVHAGGQAHHGDGDFVLEAGIVDALAGPLEVVHVVERVEVTDGGHPVLLEHVGVELDDVGGLAVQAHHVHAAGEGLQVRIGAGLAEGVHHVEGVFTAVEVAALEARTAAGLEPADARIVGGLDRGHEILGEDARAVDGLEAVAERGAHELDLLAHCSET